VAGAVLSAAVNRLPLLIPLVGHFLLSASAHAAIAAGNLTIIQNDTGNTSSGVSGSFGYSQGQISYVSGNRGDFTLRFDGANAAADLSDGIMIVSIAENGRSNEGPASGTTTADIGPGPGYATASIQPAGGGYGSAIFVGATGVSGVSAGAEWNVNQAVGYFKYSEFIGGWINNAGNNLAMSALTSSSAGLTLASGTENTTGAHIFDKTFNADTTASNGIYNVNLTGLTAPGSGLAATSQNGIMLVVGGKNEANHALSRANEDGTFDVFTRSSDTGSSENDPAAFVYIPTGQEGVAAMGRVDGEGNVTAGSGIGVVTKGGTGIWLISTTGYDPTNSVLLISPEGGTSLNSDNIYSYQYDETTKQWIVQGRDIPSATTSNPGLQNVPGEPAFSFALISNQSIPEPTTVSLGLIGLTALILRRKK